VTVKRVWDAVAVTLIVLLATFPVSDGRLPIAIVLLFSYLY
jgi:hypothetical protein